MVFISKVGNLLKQSVTKHINSELSASNPSIFQAIRCMPSSKLFVGGLSYSTDETNLREAFSSYGEVIEARVIMDRETGRSRGFGFVSFTSGEEASSAIQAMDRQVKELKMDMYPVLDELASSISTLNPSSKKKLTPSTSNVFVDLMVISFVLTQQVQKVRDEIEQLMDDGKETENGGLLDKQSIIQHHSHL